MTNTKVLITTIPTQDVARPPGILSILAGCCETINVDYVIEDLNLHLYKNLPEETTIELATDFSNNNFRSVSNQKAYDKICEHYVQVIKKTQPTHIAISIFTYASLLAGRHLLEYIKKSDIKHKYKIIIGGLGVSDRLEHLTGDLTFGEYCLKNQLIDYCVYGEGDIAFVELLKGNTDYPGINNPNQTQIMDLNVIPVPSYKNISPDDYFHSGLPEVLVTGSRGCVRSCSFCDIGHYWSKYIYKSGERIATELLEIWKITGVQKFDFSDSLINGSIKTFREFNRTLLKFRTEYPGFNPSYKGQFICRPSSQLKEQDYKEMSEAGAETLVVGIESFSNPVRDHMAKKFSNEDIDWHFQMCSKYGIKNSLLLMSGYVTETLEDHKQNLEYLKKYQVYGLSRVIYAVSLTVAGLVLLKGSPLYDKIDELGIVHDNQNFETNINEWTSLSNPTLDRKERLRRAVEVLCTAFSLGYKIPHFNMRLDRAEELYVELEKIKSHQAFQLNLIN